MPRSADREKLYIHSTPPGSIHTHTCPHSLPKVPSNVQHTSSLRTCSPTPRDANQCGWVSIFNRRHMIHGMGPHGRTTDAKKSSWTFRTFRPKATLHTDRTAKTRGKTTKQTTSSFARNLLSKNALGIVYFSIRGRHHEDHRLPPSAIITPPLDCYNALRTISYPKKRAAFAGKARARAAFKPMKSARHPFVRTTVCKVRSKDSGLSVV